MKILFNILSVIICFSTFGQTTEKVVKSEAVYLNYLPNQKKFEWYLIEPEDYSREEPIFLPDKITLKLNKRQDLRFYIDWVNPLIYRVTWIDSVKLDQTYTQLDEFISGVKQIFNNSAMAAGLGSGKSLDITDSSQTNVNKIGTTTSNLTSNSKAKVSEQIKFPDKVLLSSSIREFYFLLATVNAENLTNDDRKVINSWKEKIEEFDKNFFANKLKDYSENLDKLLKITSAETAKNSTLSIKKELSSREEEIPIELKSIELFDERLQDFNLKNKFVSSQLSSKLKSAVNEAKTLIQNEKLAIDNFKPILTQFEESLSIPSNKNKAFDSQYFMSNSISFKRGEQIESKMVLTEYQYDSETKSFKPSDNKITRDFVIKKYNFIYPTVSTGFFYSDVDIVSYGLSNSDNSSEFLVTQDTLQKNTALVAAFANFNFDLNTDFFHPFFQIGVDPTKIRPYMLLGGGVVIPASKFAISGGAVFTWQQSLNTLKVGDSVKSTTHLQNDIQYGVFDVKVKGWYLGIQYNF